MQNIVKEVLSVAQPFRAHAARQLCKGNRRLARNVERVVVQSDLKAATLAGVILDPRVVETLQLLDVHTRALLLRIEARLGRKLSRERAMLLVHNLQRVQKQSARERAVKAFLAHYEAKKAA